MKTRKLMTMLICLLLIASTVLVACQRGDGGKVETTAGTTQATTAGATTAGSTAAATAGATTAATTVPGTTVAGTTAAGTTVAGTTVAGTTVATTAGATTAATAGATTAGTTAPGTTTAATTAGTTAGTPAGTTAGTPVTQATTAATTTAPIPTDLTPSVLSRNKNQIISRLDPPITVEIKNGVTMNLQYQGWPTICAAKDDPNTIYAVSSLRIQHIDIFGAVGFCKSTDGGKTWSDMRVIIDTPLDDRDSGIVDLGGGHLMVTWFTHNADLYVAGGNYAGYRNQCTAEQLAAVDARLASLTGDDRLGFSYVAHSLDGGLTWGDPIKIPISLPHGATLMQDGKTLVSIGIPWQFNKVVGGSPVGGNFYVYMSEDGGYTWNYKSIVAFPASEGGGYEAHIIQLKDGSFVAACRYDNATGLRCFTATSKDCKRWTPMTLVETGFGGPPHLLQLRNGAVLLTYACRLTDHCSIRACLSYDGGKTWGEEFILSYAVQRNADHGYPSTVELADGTLITAYYQKHQQDKYCSFLYTKWELVSASANG